MNVTTKSPRGVNGYVATVVIHDQTLNLMLNRRMVSITLPATF